MTLPSSRRGFLAALAAFTGAGTTGAVAVASVCPAGGTILAVEPDAALLAAEARWREAVAFREEATARWSAADQAERAALGPCPPALFIDWQDEEQMVLLHLGHPPGTRQEREDDETGASCVVWTSRTLRTAIAALPGEFGRGGRTPFLIRDLKARLPAAYARDAKRTAVEARFGAAELWPAAKKAGEVERQAGQAIVDLPATTLAGLAVKMRYADAWTAEHLERADWTMKYPAPFAAVHDAVRAMTGAAS